MKIKLSMISSLLVLALFTVACGSQIVNDKATLIDALRDVGATVDNGNQIEQMLFTVEGQIIKVNGVDVQVYEFASVEAMEADATLVAPDGGSVGTTMIMWIATPHFYKTGHILVLYLGDDQATLDLIEGALGSQFAGR